MKSALKVSPAAQSLRGQVETLFYSSPGFSAGRIRTQDKATAMFAGKFCVREGDPVVLHGQWGTHAKYGRQFQAEWFEYDSAPSAEGLAQYLANHPALKGIGPVKARRIAEKYADGFDRALNERPEEIAKAAGVPISTIVTLAAEWDRVKAVRSALTILSAYGLTHYQVTMLVEKHGNGIIALLEEDPYRLVGEIRGMGFKRVDKVARQFGTAKADPSRIRAGIVSCVQEALDQGDCWVEWRELIGKANDLLLIDRLDSRELIEAQLEGLTQAGDLASPSHFGRIQVGLPFMIMMETDLAKIFRQGAQPNPVLGEKDDTDFEADFVTYAGSLNDDQRRAFINAARYSISLISGGAGSGKTFTLTSIAEFYEAQGLTVTLTAPTGKAAKRMEQVTGRPAATIHRLLEYNGREFGRGPDSPLGTDLVIVDECFDYRQPILTEHGWELIGKVVNQAMPIKVWARNPDTGKLELKSITRWIKRDAPDDLLNITAGRSDSTRNARVIRCTPDHKILTPYGFRRAGDLRPGEEVIVRGMELHPQQRSLLIGSLLGDGCMGRRHASAPQVSIVHGDAQYEYLLFKKKAMGDIAGMTSQGSSGYGDVPIWRLDLKVIDETYRIEKEMITSGAWRSGRRRWTPTNQFLQWIDELALAIWYLDNGSLHSKTLVGGSISHYASIHSERFSHEDNARLACHLGERFNLSPTVAANSRGHWFLRFNKAESEKLFSIITPFVPGCMEYKIPGKGCYQYEPQLQPDTCIARVNGIERCKPSSKYVFDIEVEDYHNYVAGNIVVSNCSMVDAPLFWRLFRAIDLTRTAVVLVGDHNQLPPVGPGDVLRDLIQSAAVPMVILDKVVRQAGVLKENCTAVLTGQVRPSVKDAATPPWLVADRFTEAESARDFLISLFEGGTLDRLGYDLVRDVQVLTPTHMGPLGTRELNIVLQRIIQQRLHGFITPPVAPGRSPRIYLHDKVMQTRNDYKLGVMNGAVGIVVEEDGRGNLVVDFDGERVEMDRESGATGNLQLAYACTIHKSQGSEYPCVICVVHKAHSFQHHRGLLYTGVTRARKTAVVIGDRWGIRNCAQIVKNLDRATYLSFLLDPDCGEAR